MSRSCLAVILVLVACLSPVRELEAQAERYTAEEINIQKIFIEANKNKILGAYDEAERLFREVLDKDKRNHTAAYELARVYIAKDDYAKALEYVNLALRIDDSVSWYHLLKGDILEARQEFLKAAEVYRTLSERYPEEASYYEHLTDIYEKVQQPEEALQTLNRYEAAFGIIEPVIRRKFDLLNELGRPEEALREVDKLIRIYPDELDYRHLAAAYARQVGLDERANAYYADILKIDPNDGKANVAMASAFKTEGDDIAYLGSIRTIIRNAAIDVDAKVQELIPYVDEIMDQRDSVLEESLAGILEDLQKYHPHEAKVYAILGDYYNAMDQFEDARKAYEKTIALDDSVFPVWEQLIGIQAKQRDWPSLIKTTEMAMDVFPNQAIIFFYHGIGCQMKEDYQEAESSFTQALIMSGRDPVLTYQVLVQLGEVYLAQSNYTKSDEAFKKALEINDEAYPALRRYAYSLALRGQDLARAQSMIKKALAAKPGSAEARIIEGFIQLQSGHPDEAKTTLEDLVTNADAASSPMLYEHLGDAFLALDDPDAAVLNWKKALELGGNEDRIVKKLNANKVN